MPSCSQSRLAPVVRTLANAIFTKRKENSAGARLGQDEDRDWRCLSELNPFHEIRENQEHVVLPHCLVVSANLGAWPPRR